MVSKRTREIIEREMPGARIVEDHEREPFVMPPGVVKAPSVEAMKRKWGHLAPTATKPLDPVEAVAPEGTVVAVKVRRPLKNPSLPASLQSRTVIVDTESGEIIGEQG